jgi:thiamine monophosphate synthase
VAGLTYAREVAENIPIPALAIAGITPGNVDEVIATGITGIAVTASVVGCDDPLGAAKRFKERLAPDA